MGLHLLFDCAHLSVSYDCTNHWLYGEWKGEQELCKIKESCALALQQLPPIEIRGILNDSTQAVGNWTAAAEWLGQELFPLLATKGFTHMAWVYAADFNSRFSIDATLRCATGLTIVTFDDLDAACTWLQHADELQTSL